MTDRAAPSHEPLVPLVPPAIRRPAMAVIGLSLVALVVLGVRYHDAATAGGLDSWIYANLPEAVRAHTSALVAVADAVPACVVVGGLILAAVSGMFRTWNLAVLALVGPAGTVLAAELGKLLVNRTIGGGLALPSGHTAAATSLLLVLAVAMLRRTPAHVASTAFALLVCVTGGAAVVGLAMVSLDFHYATDTVAGYFTALAVTLGCAGALDAVGRRRTPALLPVRTSASIEPGVE